MSAPFFAVVGHPNKGKSSLVATLAHDDSVAIGAQPGTTRRADAFPMRLDGELLYTLVDTPGFQRARRVLHWLQERADAKGASAAERAALVAEFAATPGHAEQYPDEVALLTPIVQGAGILYVVDGAVPYSSEYEAEMEILRWSGRPSIAIVNPIRESTHVADWQRALSQYFRVVRVVNAMEADTATQLELLLAFAELEDDWREPLRRAAEGITQDRTLRRRRAAGQLAELLAEALSLSVEHRVGPDEDPHVHEASLFEQYQGRLRELERRARQNVQEIYDHRALVSHEGGVDLLEEDLFSEASWLAFGLSRRDLVAVGAASGAAAGGVVDIALGGASLFTVTAMSAAVGGVLGWLGAGRLAKLRVVDRPLGGRALRCGPATDLNFPFVLFGRARYHHARVATRSHARRDALHLDAGGGTLELTAGDRSALQRVFSKLRRSEPGDARRAEALAAAATAIEAVLQRDDDTRLPLPSD